MTNQQIIKIMNIYTEFMHPLITLSARLHTIFEEIGYCTISVDANEAIDPEYAPLDASELLTELADKCKQLHVSSLKLILLAEPFVTDYVTEFLGGFSALVQDIAKGTTNYASRTMYAYPSTYNDLNWLIQATPWDDLIDSPAPMLNWLREESTDDATDMINDSYQVTYSEYILNNDGHKIQNSWLEVYNRVSKYIPMFLVIDDSVNFIHSINLSKVAPFGCNACSILWSPLNTYFNDPRYFQDDMSDILQSLTFSMDGIHLSRTVFKDATNTMASPIEIVDISGIINLSGKHSLKPTVKLVFAL